MQEKLNSYRGLLMWSLTRHKFYIPMFIMIQVILSLAITYGFSFITNASDDAAKSFLYTGAMTMNLIAVGCVLGPQIVSETKHNGIFEYQKTLPISRLGILLSDVLTWGCISLPGTVVSMLLSALQFGGKINVGFFEVGSLLLIVFTLTLVGFAIAYLFPPNMVSLVTQVIMLGGLLFSPITYSADRLPDWAANIYNVLPFVPVSRIIRSSLFSLQSIEMGDYIVVFCWGAIGFLVSLFILLRRK
jgi:ABC-2 type transport system permease protein